MDHPELILMLLLRPDFSLRYWFWKKPGIINAFIQNKAW